MAASPNDLLAALNVMLLLTMALFGRVANGVYFWPLLTKSQWISSASTMTRRRRQISPSRIRSSALQQLPVGFCGLQRMKRVGLVADAALEVVEVDRIAAVDEPSGLSSA